MDCSEFHERYSDFHDGLLGPREAAEFEVHLDGCSSCSEFRRAHLRGAEVLRGMGTVSLSVDFEERLKHRIFHLRDSASPVPGSTSSGASTASLLGIALLLAGAAWTPSALRLLDSGEQLPAGSPQTARAPVFAPATSFELRQPGVPSLFAEPVRPLRPVGDDFWTDSRDLLYELAPFSERYRGAGSLTRSGLE